MRSGQADPIAEFVSKYLKQSAIQTLGRFDLISSRSRRETPMSLFSTIETECPACGVTSRYELAFSVNADRRPELRAQMLHRTFQRLTCPACGQLFRIEPQFTYIHAAGHQ